MDLDIVNRMREEEADLARKLKAVREFLTAYGEPAPNAMEATPQVSKPKASGAREKVEISGFGEQARKTVALAMLGLTTSPHPLKTRQLVEFIEAMNHEISGENKINALGALLSRSVDITSHGKAGWSLIDPEKAASIANAYMPNENDPPAGFGAVRSGSDASQGSATNAPEARINPFS